MGYISHGTSEWTRTFRCADYDVVDVVSDEEDDEPILSDQREIGESTDTRRPITIRPPRRPQENRGIQEKGPQKGVQIQALRGLESGPRTTPYLLCCYLQ